MPPPDHADIAVAIAKIDTLSADMAELKTSLKELTGAVARLAVIEERQSSSNESIGRAFKEIKALTERVTALEQAQPIQKQSSDFVQIAIKYILVAVLGAFVAGLWRTPSTHPEQSPPAITGK